MSRVPYCFRLGRRVGRSLGPTPFALALAAVAASSPASAQIGGWFRDRANDARDLGETAVNGTVGAANTVANGTVNVANAGWNGARTAATTAGGTIGRVVVNDVGQPVAYTAVRSVVPLYRATAATVVNSPIVFTQVGDRLQIDFRRGLAGATNVGQVFIDRAGNITGTAMAGLVDGVQYGYEFGTIIVQNLLNLRCEQILNLSFGPDFSYTSSNPEAISADCARNIAVGFACAIPGSVYDLIGASRDVYRQVIRGMGRSPCTSVPIPPANFVCGALNSQVSQMNHIVDCLRNVRNARPGGGAAPQLDGSVCRSIGDVAFGIVLDIATDGAATSSLVRKIARAVQQLYAAQERVETLEGLVQTLCPSVVGRNGAPSDAFAAALRANATPSDQPVTVFANVNYEAVRVTTTMRRVGFMRVPQVVSTPQPNWPLSDDIRVAPAGVDNTISSVRVPDGSVVSMFSEPNYQGLCQSFTSSVADITNTNIGNDQASSVRVGTYCPGSTTVQVFTQPNYQGRVVDVGVDIASFTAAGVSIQSLKRIGTVPVALYSLPNFRGTCVQLTADTPTWTGFPWFRPVESLRINHTCEPTAAIITAPTRAPIPINTSIPDLRDLGYTLPPLGPQAALVRAPEQSFARTLQPSPARSAIRVAPRPAAPPPLPIVTARGSSSIAVYNGPNYTGRCVTVGPNNSSATDSLPGSVVSIKLNATCEGPELVVPPSILVTASNLCIGVQNNGGPQNQTCTGAPQQLWSSNGEWIKNADGRCLSVASEDLAIVGSTAVMQPCDGSDRQRWVMRDGRLVSFLGRCLDVSRADLWREGGALRLVECSTSVTERFRAIRRPDGGIWPPAVAPPVVPMDTSLYCPMNVAYLGGPLCQSGTDILPVELTAGRAMRVELGTLPPSGSLSFESARGATIANRDRHEPGMGSYTVSVWVAPLNPRYAANLEDSENELAFRRANDMQTFLADGIRLGTPGYRLFRSGTLLKFNIAAVGGASETLLRPFRMDGTWHHFVAVIDRTRNVVEAYVDGSNQGWRGPNGTSIPITGWGAITSAEPLTLGNGASVGNGLSLDELRIYNRALSAAEIAQLAAVRGIIPPAAAQAIAAANAAADAGVGPEPSAMDASINAGGVGAAP